MEIRLIAGEFLGQAIHTDQGFGVVSTVDIDGHMTIEYASGHTDCTHYTNVRPVWDWLECKHNENAVTKPETANVTNPEAANVTNPEAANVTNPETANVTNPETANVTNPETANV